MQLNLSRFETLEHREFQHRRRVGDFCVPRPSSAHLETQRSTIQRVRRGPMCSKVSVKPSCKTVRTTCINRSSLKQPKLTRAVFEKCCFQTYGIQRKRELPNYQHIVLVHMHLHSSVQCIHTHAASADTHLRVPVLTGSANLLSGKSSSGCIPVAQRVWNQHQ